MWTKLLSIFSAGSSTLLWVFRASIITALLTTFGIGLHKIHTLSAANTKLIEDNSALSQQNTQLISTLQDTERDKQEAEDRYKRIDRLSTERDNERQELQQEKESLLDQLAKIKEGQTNESDTNCLDSPVNVDVDKLLYDSNKSGKGGGDKD